MTSTHAQGMNLPIWESLPAGGRDTVINFRARWQTAVETLSGHALQKLRLELAHSVSELLTSTHGSNDNDRNLNFLRPSHLPVSA